MRSRFETVNTNQVRELIRTEKTYNEALAVLQLALITEVCVDNNELLIKLKPCIDELKSISDRLLKHIELTLTNYVSEEDPQELRASRVALFEEFFKAFKSHAEIFEEFAKLNRANKESFKKIDFFLQTHNKQLGLSDHLIMPIQRGPRYALLVNEIIKSSKDLSQESLTALTDLQKSINEFLEFTNSSMAQKKDSSNVQKSPSDAQKDSSDIKKDTSDSIGYRFGDITRAITRTFFGAANPVSSENAEPAATKPYQFGDYTRAWLASFTTTQPEEEHEVEIVRDKPK